MFYSVTKNRFYENVVIVFFTLYTILALQAELVLTKSLIVTNAQLVLVSFVLIILATKNRVFFLPGQKFNRNYMLLVVLFGFILFNSIFIRKELLLGAILNALVGSVMGEFLSKLKGTYRLLLSPFYLLCIFIFIRLTHNPDPNEVFIRSRNYISFFLAITVAPYYFVAFKNKTSASVLPAILFFVLSVYSLGRSGIITSLLVFIAALLSIKLSKFTKRLFLVIVALVLPYATYQFFSMYVSITDIRRIVRIADWSDLGGRSTIWSNYLKELNVFRLFFGMDVNTPKILDIGGSYMPGHVHSSILNFLSVGGIMAIVFIMKYFSRLFSYRFSNFPLVLLGLGLIFRLFTETGCLFGHFDYVVWMFVFLNARYLVNKNSAKYYLIPTNASLK